MRADNNRKRSSPTFVADTPVTPINKKTCRGRGVIIVPDVTAHNLRPSQTSSFQESIHRASLASENPFLPEPEKNEKLLPDGVLVKIFANLGCQEQLACRLVNRHWCALIDALPKLRVADACTFYCGGDLKTPMPRAPARVEGYYPSALNWLKSFGLEGQKAAAQLGHLVHNKDHYLPAKLLFSAAQVLEKTELLSCKMVQSFQHIYQMTCTCLSPDEQHFVSAARDYLKICSLVDEQWQVGPPLRYRYWVRSIGFSPDSRYLVITVDRTAHIYQFVGNKWLEHSALSPCYSGYDPCFSADGNFLVTCSGEQSMAMYRLVNDQWVQQKTALDTGKVREICFHPRDNCLITNQRRGPVKIWRQVNETWEWEATLEGSANNSGMHLSPDGTRLLITRTESHCYGPITTIQIWHGVPGEWTQETSFEINGVPKIRFSPCGHTFATLPATIFVANQRIKILQFIDGTWEHLPGRVNHVHFSQEANRIATVPLMGAVTICRLDGLQVHKEASLPDWPWTKDVVFSPHGNHLLILPDEGGNVKIWGVFAGQWQEKATLPHFETVESARFSADGRYIFTLSGMSLKNTVVNIWTVTGQEHDHSPETEAAVPP